MKEKTRKFWWWVVIVLTFPIYLVCKIIVIGSGIDDTKRKP